jgi:hypothetical protein
MTLPAAIVLAAALLLALLPASNWLSPAAAQSTLSDYEQDPEWIAEQKRLEDGLKQIRKEAEAFHLELKETAEQEVAEPAAPKPVKKKTPPDSPGAGKSAAWQMQEFLREAGCYHGNIDGAWGEQSRMAWADFARHSKVKREMPEPQLEILAVLRDFYQGGRVCPPACDARHEMRDGKCVLKSCAKGQRLTPSGKCASVRFGSLCEAGTGRLAERDCHFWHSMMMEDRHKGLKSSPAITKYNCQCR